MPTPPPFPFERGSRVVYSVRGLYSFAAVLLAMAAMFGLLAGTFVDRIEAVALAFLIGMIVLLVAGTMWCVICARRVARWEREYERVMGVPPYH